MKIVANYNNCVLAEEDSFYLTSNGVPTLIYGRAAPVVAYAEKGTQPICIAVPDELLDVAGELLEKKRAAGVEPTHSKDFQK